MALAMFRPLVTCGAVGKSLTRVPAVEYREGVEYRGREPTLPPGSRAASLACPQPTRGTAAARSLPLRHSRTQPATPR